MLWLKFKNENGEEQRIEIDRDVFTVGRHSECDLTYTDGLLSREHMKIEKIDGKITVADLGSSNGTTVNGAKISGPVDLKDGDVIDLGGGLQMTAEIEADAEPDGGAGAADLSPEGPEIAAPPAAAVNIPAASSPDTGGGIPMSFFIVAPLLGIFVIAIVIGAILLLGGGDTEIADNNDSRYTSETNEDEDKPRTDPGDVDDDSPTRTANKSPTPSSSATPSNSGTTAATPTSPTGGGTGTTTGGNTDETVRVEQNGAAFLRQAAQNDPRAFLTGEQAAKVNAKVKQLGRSAGLADNISSARKNASALKTLAATKNLKPQFLAVAAITKLGGSRGDVLQAAQSVIDVYDKLAIQVSNENADDILLLVAAYDQGAAGETMKLRNMLQNLAEQPGAPGAREIRTIWYLEKNGKISAAEYERALNFLAIGTIAQNPKDFGVNTEALRL